MSSPPGPAPASRIRLLAALVVLGLAATGVYFFWPRPDPTGPPAQPSTPLPPLTESPFLNTRRGVAYVGDQACAPCHDLEHTAYRAVEAALALDPFRGETRALLIAIYLETGERVRARSEFDVLGVVKPDHQEKIRTWFADRLRRFD